jgi:hypothetical protein
VGIVIIAIYLDRVTRPLGRIGQGKKSSKKGGALSRILPGRKTDPDTAGATGAGAEKVSA